MNIKDYILTEASYLAVDETEPNILCPECGGGTHKESSFAITRIHDGFLYICYRATCNIKGYLAFGKIFPSKKKKEFVPKFYTDSTISLPHMHRLYFWKRFGIKGEELKAAGITYSPKRDTYVFPIKDYMGRTVGVVDRAYWNRKPKSISYWYNDCVKVHFQWGKSSFRSTNLAHEQPPLLLVEDMVSGIKGSRFMDTIVLLGTNFNYEIASHIQHFTSDVVMALDADATKKAIGYKKKFGVMFRNFRVLRLDKDVKDMTNEEIEEKLYQ